MLTGVTSSGFHFEIDEDNLDDIEVLEGLAKIDKGNPLALPDVIERILGTEQKKALYEHIRKEKGKVPTSTVNQELTDIILNADNGKN